MPMWKVVPGIALSLLPRRWRAAIPEETVPWVPAAILSGMLEANLAVGGLTYWYSHSVTNWAADALDSALRNGPAAEYDPHLLGLSAFVIWSLHPLTWFLASFFVEGLVRIVAAISLEQILPMWLLASADWFYGKVTRRPRERGVADVPGGREQLRSFSILRNLPQKPSALESFPTSSRNRSMAPSPSWKFDPRTKRPCGCRRASFASTTSTIALNRCAKAGVRGRLFIACGVLPPASRGGT